MKKKLLRNFYDVVGFLADYTYMGLSYLADKASDMDDWAYEKRKKAGGVAGIKPVLVVRDEINTWLAAHADEVREGLK